MISCRAECLLYLGQYSQASQEVSTLLQRQTRDVEALHLKALLAYYQVQCMNC